MCSMTTPEQFSSLVWLKLAHSLNLSGNTTAESCVEAVTFFGVVQKLYVFLSSSTSRWNVLMEKLKTTATHGSVPKRLIETRWSAQHVLMHSTV